jgi:hypothetical protein
VAEFLAAPWDATASGDDSEGALPMHQLRSLTIWNSGTSLARRKKEKAARAEMRPPELAKPFFDHRRLGQNPTVDGAMIDLEATFPEHLLKIPIVEWITQIPGNRLHIGHASKCRPLKSSFDCRFNFSAIAFRIIGSLHNFRSGISLPMVNIPLSAKICDRPMRSLHSNDRLGFRPCNTPSKCR